MAILIKMITMNKVYVYSEKINYDVLVKYLKNFYNDFKLENINDILILNIENANINELYDTFLALSFDIFDSNTIYIAGNLKTALEAEKLIISFIKNLQKGVYLAGQALCYLDSVTRNNLLKVLLNYYLTDGNFLSILTAYFNSNLNVSETALELYMHRNTLIYKLNSFKEKTAIDLHNFKEAALIYNYLLQGNINDEKN